jgi:hypothetical protein
MAEKPFATGTLRNLRRYPVKGIAGEDLSEVFVTFAGLIGDRIYAFSDPQNHTNFPWMTARKWPGMILLQPRFLEPPSSGQEWPVANTFRVEVTTPEGDRYDVGDPRFHQYLEKQFGRSLEFRFSERSMHDARPVSLISRQTIEALSAETNLTLDHRRFRANFVVDWDSTGPFFEDSLVGRRARIGDVLEVMVVKNDARCNVITLDPDTAAASPEVLQTVAKHHASCAGVYGAVLREGIVRRGDRVSVD